MSAVTAPKSCTGSISINWYEWLVLSNLYSDENAVRIKLFCIWQILLSLAHLQLYVATIWIYFFLSKIWWDDITSDIDWLLALLENLSKIDNKIIFVFVKFTLLLSQDKSYCIRMKTSLMRFAKILWKIKRFQLSAGYIS